MASNNLQNQIKLAKGLIKQGKKKDAQMALEDIIQYNPYNAGMCQVV